MSSKHLRGDINYAWPTAEVAVMGAKVKENFLGTYFIIKFIWWFCIPFIFIKIIIILL